MDRTFHCPYVQIPHLVSLQKQVCTRSSQTNRGESSGLSWSTHIFHSDNGREFVNNLLHSLLDNWSSGNVTFVTGRPRHSQSQGLVERGNAIIEDKIAAIKTLKSPLGWLTDNHMFLANYVLKKEYPCAKGLQDTLLQQNLSWDVPTGEFAQILHTEGNTG